MRRSPYHCPKCLAEFADIWELKRHQEKCLDRTKEKNK